jgi:hydroxymethylbilane synthase
VYPIALDLRNRLVVVVGGGKVAARKIPALLEAGARIRIVAPSAAPFLADAAARGELDLVARPFEPADLDGAVLAFAATGDPAVNAAVVGAARSRRVLVDDTSGSTPSDFATPLAHRTGPLTFAVDTGGTAPSLATRLVAELRERYDERYGRAAATLGRARDYAKSVVPPEARAGVLAELAGREIAELAAMNPSTVENEVEAAFAALSGNGTPVPVAFTSLVCATRASALAMWQTRHVIATFAQAGLISTVLQISTKGDRVQDRSLAALGTDSIFVKELELALREHRADYAVHSCKDLPSTLPDDMLLAAIGPRADPRDAFCSERYASLDALPPGALIGTSSPRRRAQLQALRPDLRFEVIRGNVDTRLRKLREGEFDAILLAAAGLSRLGLRATHTVPIAPETLIPAVGQGALAIEVRASDSALAKRIHGLFADPATELAVRAERAFLRTLRGGCQAPVGAHATYAEGRLALDAAIAAPDGSEIVRGKLERAVTDPAQGEALAVELAQRLLAEGGAALLRDAEPGFGEAPLSGRLFLLPHAPDRPSQIAPALRGAGAEVIEAADSEHAVRALGGRVPSGLLFPSSAAVRAVTAYLARLRDDGERPLVAAMGDASSAAASEAGFPPDVVPTEPTVAAFVQSLTQFVLKESGAPFPA